MSLISKPNEHSSGDLIKSAETNENFDTIYNDYNGNIDNNNIKAGAGIVDTKLAQITTASKVSGAAITLLTSLPAGAGEIPLANLPSIDEDDMSSDSDTDLPTQQSVKAYVDAATISSILDYGTSASSSTAKNISDLHICYGSVNVGGNSTQAITNLPFTSATSYTVTVCYNSSTSFDDGYAGAVMDSGSQCTITNEQASARDINWFAIGT
jgi:hypothetical protein